MRLIHRVAYITGSVVWIQNTKTSAIRVCSIWDLGEGFPIREQSALLKNCKAGDSPFKCPAAQKSLYHNSNVNGSPKIKLWLQAQIRVKYKIRAREWSVLSPK